MRQNLRVPSLRKISLVAGAAAAALAIAGCTSDPGAAAIIGNDRISDTQLHDAVDAALSNPTFAGLVGSQRTELTRQELSNLIVLRLFLAAAAKDGVTVTPEQVHHQIAAYVQQVGSLTALDSELAQNGTPPSDLYLSVEQSLLLQGIVTKQTGSQSPTQDQINAAGLKILETETQQLGVHVSPRYGSWSPSAARVNALTSAVSVSTTHVATPAPTVPSTG
jgi:hypothetical protein